MIQLYYSNIINKWIWFNDIKRGQIRILTSLTISGFIQSLNLFSNKRITIKMMMRRTMIEIMIQTYFLLLLMLDHLLMRLKLLGRCLNMRGTPSGRFSLLMFSTICKTSGPNLTELLLLSPFISWAWAEIFLYFFDVRNDILPS